jgi:hypothetical protein
MKYPKESLKKNQLTTYQIKIRFLQTDKSSFRSSKDMGLIPNKGGDIGFERHPLLI